MSFYVLSIFGDNAGHISMVRDIKEYEKSLQAHMLEVVNDVLSKVRDALKKNTGLFGNFSQHGGRSSQFPKLL